MTLTKRSFKAKIILMMLTAILLVPQLVSADSTMPLTSSPVNMIQPRAPLYGYQYLQSSTVSYKDKLNQTLEITVTTSSKSTVDTLGVSIGVQKWTGIAWIDFGSTSTINSVNTNINNAQVTKQIESGQYFRVKVTHTAKKGTFTEQAVEYTDSFVTN